GYPFATVVPRAERNVPQHTIGLTFLIESGAHIYVERINVRGNNRTREEVIRRELDITEGDAYNRALFDRAEKRLKNLGLFKTVKITNEPGSVADRILVNITVEEQQTGDFNVSGGYSTSDGPLGEITVSERNLFGAGIFGKATVTFGEYTHGFDVGMTDPYFLGNRLAVGFDIFDKQNLVSSVQSYGTS